MGVGGWDHGALMTSFSGETVRYILNVRSRLGPKKTDLCVRARGRAAFPPTTAVKPERRIVIVHFIYARVADRSVSDYLCKEEGRVDAP